MLYIEVNGIEYGITLSDMWGAMDYLRVINFSTEEITDWLPTLEDFTTIEIIRGLAEMFYDAN